MHVVFDLDRTLSDPTHREDLLEREPKDWAAFTAASKDDAPINEVLAVLRSLYDGDHQIEIWTGREVSAHSATVHWLSNYGVSYDKLRMRPEGDYRPASELKGEWLAASEHKPDLVFDDDPVMAAWWRSRGIRCAQVGV